VVQNSVKQIGIKAPYSIGQNGFFTYFLGSGLIPYRLAGLNLQPIGNPAIGQEIQKYSQTSDAYGVCFGFDNQRFYLLSFPSGNRTWLYNEGAGVWTNLASGTDGSQHLISDVTRAYDKNLAGDRTNGNVYELDLDTYTDNGEIIQRQRATATIDGATFGQPDVEITMSRLRLRIEPGQSLVTAESQIMMQYSDDNGRTWSQERWKPVGDQGGYQHIVEWQDLGRFYRRQFRFTMSDAIKWVLISATADVEFGIG
jgi:hypothetical protein